MILFSHLVPFGHDQNVFQLYKIAHIVISLRQHEKSQPDRSQYRYEQDGVRPECPAEKGRVSVPAREDIGELAVCDCEIGDCGRPCVHHQVGVVHCEGHILRIATTTVLIRLLLKSSL
jgi:hypothetical protein